MLNHQGYVAECTGDNVFMIRYSSRSAPLAQPPRNALLLTPPTYVGALKGITRQGIIEIAAKQKIAFEERTLTRHDLFNADEVFLTGTAAEVIPVVKIDGRVIGTGKPGKVTQQLLKGFREIVRKDGVKYALGSKAR
jgi:branched-chain amino acid aminotransferase